MTDSDHVDRIDQVLCATLDISPHSQATSRIQSRRNVSIYLNYTYLPFFFITTYFFFVLNNVNTFYIIIIFENKYKYG